MDEHCVGCHTLSFDADDPTRLVPHGEPAGVVQALVEYYSARLLGSDRLSHGGGGGLRRVRLAGADLFCGGSDMRGLFVGADSLGG